MGNNQSVVDCGDSLQASFPLERTICASRKPAGSRCWECNAEFTLKGNFLVVEMELEDGDDVKMPVHIFVMIESIQLLNSKGICGFAYEVWADMMVFSYLCRQWWLWPVRVDCMAVLCQLHQVLFLVIMTNFTKTYMTGTNWPVF